MFTSLKYIQAPSLSTTSSHMIEEKKLTEIIASFEKSKKELKETEEPLTKAYDNLNNLANEIERARKIGAKLSTEYQSQGISIKNRKFEELPEPLKQAAAHFSSLKISLAEANRAYEALRTKYQIIKKKYEEQKKIITLKQAVIQRKTHAGFTDFDVNVNAREIAVFSIFSETNL